MKSKRQFAKFDDLFKDSRIEYKYLEADREMTLKSGIKVYSYGSEQPFLLSELDNLLESKDLQGFSVSYFWDTFKNNRYELNFSTNLYFDFDEYNYQILTTNHCFDFNEDRYQIITDKKMILMKNYDEVVTDIEIQKVVTDWVRLIFEDLKKEIEKMKK